MRRFAAAGCAAGRVAGALRRPMVGGQPANRPYSDRVPIRAIAFVLALLVAAGAASATVMASPDVAGVIADVVDDGVPDLEPGVVVTEVVVAEPARRELRATGAPPAEMHGRLHGVSVFRPPR
jgi:hypothetical protein